MCPHSGMSSPVPCTCGRYCDSPGLTEGIRCPAGFVCDQTHFF